MEFKRGIAVSPGVAIGPALVLDTEGVRITHRTVPPDQIAGEIARLRHALDEAAGRGPRDPPAHHRPPRPAIGNIFGAQRVGVRGPRHSATQIENLIRTQVVLRRVRRQPRHPRLRQAVSRTRPCKRRRALAGRGPPPGRRAHRPREADPRPPARPELRAAPGTDRAGHRARQRPDAVGDGRLHAADGPRLRHRERRPDQPHRHPRRGAGDPRGRRPRPLPHRRLRRRHRHRRRRRGRAHPRPGRGDARAVRGEAGRRAVAAPTATSRSATSPPVTQDGVRDPPAGEHRVGPGGRRTASTAGPRASGCTAPSSCT